jgi:hypothetical protein
MYSSERLAEEWVQTFQVEARFSPSLMQNRSSFADIPAYYPRKYCEEIHPAPRQQVLCLSRRSAETSQMFDAEERPKLGSSTNWPSMIIE